MASSSLLLALLSLSVLPFLMAQEGNGGGHFRYATMYWSKTDDAMSNTVEITVESAWRRSYSSRYFTEVIQSGETVLQINGQVPPAVHLGDGTTRYLDAVKLTAMSESEDWVLGTQVITHTYNTPNHRGEPWTISFGGCCRIDGGVNRGDGSWHMETTIDLLTALRSPRIVSLPVVFVMDGPADFETMPLRVSDAPAGSRTVFSLADSSSEELQITVQRQLASLNLNTAALLAGAGGGHAVLHVGLVAVTTDSEGHVMSSVPAEIMVNMSAAMERPAFDPSTLVLFGSDAPAVAYVGFEFEANLRGYQAVGVTDYVGYTVGVLPPGVQMSTVRGRGTSVSDAAEMTLRWTPCLSDLGLYVVCIDIVNSEGLAATQRCLRLSVELDQRPSLSISLDGMEIAENGPPPQPLYIGRRYHFMVSAIDSNAKDHLTIAVNGSLPPDAVLLDASSSATSAMTSRELVFAPKHNHGGYNTLHCFTATDACGTSTHCGGEVCVGRQDTVNRCFRVMVQRCEYTLRAGEELQQIANIYHSDWLQLWSHNEHILSPDEALQPGTILHIGRTYDVQPYDTLEAVSQRFGMSKDAFVALNADMMGKEDGQAVCTSIQDCQNLGPGPGQMYQWCILPSSCTGQRASIYTV
mmetsp:Transcript_32314/g.77148  ORF Transcript_32314/g.77148 Transcript_32314/m.77148 type:complete len:637 (-) Transcript_32314:89-1999(-)